MRTMALLIALQVFCESVQASDTILVPVARNALGERTVYREEVCTRTVPVEEEVIVERVEKTCMPGGVWCDVIVKSFEKRIVNKEVSFVTMKEYKEKFPYSYTYYQEISAKCPVKLVMKAAGPAIPEHTGDHGPGADHGGMAQDQSALAKFMESKREYQTAVKSRLEAELALNLATQAVDDADNGTEQSNALKKKDTAYENLKQSEILESSKKTSLEAARSEAKAEINKVLQE